MVSIEKLNDFVCISENTDHFLRKYRKIFSGTRYVVWHGS